MAIEELSQGLSIESTNIECLYLRASCYHAVGEYADAVLYTEYIFQISSFYVISFDLVHMQYSNKSLMVIFLFSWSNKPSMPHLYSCLISTHLWIESRFNWSSTSQVIEVQFHISLSLNKVPRSIIDVKLLNYLRCLIKFL